MFLALQKQTMNFLGKILPIKRPTWHYLMLSHLLIFVLLIKLFTIFLRMIIPEAENLQKADLLVIVSNNKKNESI